MLIPERDGYIQDINICYLSNTRKVYSIEMIKQGTGGAASTFLLIIPVIGYLSTRHVLLYPSSWEEWLFVDYLGRLLVLAYVFSIPQVRDDISRMFSKPWPDIQHTHRILILVLMVALAIMFETIVDIPQAIVYQHFPDTVHFRYFKIESTLWLALDLTVGLALVAFSEEILFRGCLVKFLARYTDSSFVLVVVSAIIFGLMHWPTGVDNIAATTLTGVFLGIVYLWSKSLVPCVVIHYCINVVNFWPS